MDHPECGRRVSGHVVDRVSDVIGLAAVQIRPAPEFSSSFDTRYITGLGTVDERMLDPGGHRQAHVFERHGAARRSGVQCTKGPKSDPRGSSRRSSQQARGTSSRAATYGLFVSFEAECAAPTGALSSSGQVRGYRVRSSMRNSLLNKKDPT